MGLFELEKYGERTAIEDGDRICTYGELYVLSEEIAHEIGKRTLCFILASNTVASVAGYLGCINNGIVPVMIDGQLHRDLLDQMINCYKPSFIWKPADDSSDNFDGYSKALEMEGYSLLKADNECPYEMNEELALLITTSGSTGSPKLVKQSYKNLKANTESIIEYLEITDGERAITSLPMNYVYGLSVINTHIYAGAVIILTDLNCYSPKFWSYFSKKKATSFAGVPFMYEMMNKLSIEETVDLSSLKTMTQAGGKLSTELQAKYARFAHEN
nr:AMP-binding protein [Lachnospiraceae bacterium]